MINPYAIPCAPTEPDSEGLENFQSQTVEGSNTEAVADDTLAKPTPIQWPPIAGTPYNVEQGNEEIVVTPQGLVFLYIGHLFVSCL